MGRIEKFLKAEEIDTSYIQYHESTEDGNAIVIENGNFFWSDEIENTDHPDASRHEETLKIDDDQKANNKNTTESVLIEEGVNGNYKGKLKYKKVEDKNKIKVSTGLMHVAPIMESIVVVPSELEKNKNRFPKEYKVIQEEGNNNKKDENLVSISLGVPKIEPPTIKETKIILRNINLKIVKGSFTAVIGE